ncbi:hypothetical protein A2866_05620 [Candidatus Roizmanbacteria bacterium RIFCSPHIGHO2_01_FULL_39_8]|uniref:Bacterial sugar transferase domain-containing protein n=1 Tax=Candidatus Roizmanbacteria bacterium RIFCSPHIGHO2_01_FULL_39_8 TaxID=1802033 RepID=A0A1F7GSH1_9BACT|nr:MAG: hypothetical protein A2866_05620 [Candidatus Roizmanbacteria bacterium RIFCSPHIGHO2_01_FULL_39_8]
MLVAGTIIAYNLRINNFFGFLDLPPARYDFTSGQYTLWAVIFSLGSLFVFRFFSLYNLKSTRGSLRETYQVFGAVSSIMMAIILVMFLNRKLFSSRVVILTAWSAAIVLVSLGRMLIRYIQRQALKYGYGVHRLVVVGNAGVGQKLVKEFSRPANLAYRVIAHLKDTKNVIDKIKRIKAVDEIIQCDPLIAAKDLSDLYELADERNLVFKYVPNLFEAQTINVEILTVRGIPIMEIKKTPLDGWGRITKRTIDIFISFWLIIFTAPIMLAIILAIKLDSSGPILFSKFKGKKIKRVGQDAKPFNYFKFRSMRHESHNERYTTLAKLNSRYGSPLVKIKDDPRITKAGRFIRRFSLDELPEFFLVLVGKMSLVGPRPHLIEEVAKYQKHHLKVLRIKPGITGMAQISGRSDLNFEEEVKLDSYYIENWSLRRDLWILLHTPSAVLKKRKEI